jgi:competence protein ComEC
VIPTRSSLGHRAPLLWIVLPFATGLALASSSGQPIPVGALAGLAIIATCITLVLARQAHPAGSIGFVVAMIAGGAIYHELRRNRLPDWAALPAREANLTVRVDREFESPPQFTSHSFIGTVLETPEHLQDLQGQRIYLRVRGTPALESVSRTSVIQVIGHLTPLPRKSSDRDDFMAYLIDAGLNFSLIRGRLDRIVHPATALARRRDLIKAQGGEALSLGLERHPELAGALRAMLLGERHLLAADDKTLFVRSGTMHLFAISGLHIGIIAGALFGVLRVFRLPRLATFLASTILLGAYVDLIGRTPSAVRAWLMVSCVLMAVLLRAPRNAISAIAASALLVLLLDPMQLFSAGFQMSYGIVFALLLYGLPLGEYLQKRFRPWRDLPEMSLTHRQKIVRESWETLLSVVGLAWSATLIGLISGIAFFGWFTPLAFLANLILIPAASLAIIGGFLALIFGWLGMPPLALLFNHAAAVVLLAMQGFLGAAVKLPFLTHPAQFRWDYWGPFSLLVVLGAMVYGYTQRWETKTSPWWGPPAISLLMLVIGVRFD